jgi:ketosteroid isomerase-like protein
VKSAGHSMKRWRFGAAIFPLFLITACAPSAPDLAAERARLLQRDAEWATVAAAGTDVERILSYWTDDAIVYPPRMPALVGKDAVRGYVEASLKVPGFRINWTSSDVTFSPDGQLAYMLSKNSVTFTGPDGAPLTTHGRGVTVWRREPNGIWRCAVDIWNEEPTEPVGK